MPPPPVPPPVPPPPPPATAYAATVLADTPASYWRLGEASGTVAANAVSGGPAGRYVGAIRLGQPGAILGDANTAISLERAPYVTVTHAPALATADSFTLEAWVRHRSTGTHDLFNKGTKGYQLYFDATDKLVLRQIGIGTITSSTIALTDHTNYHHIVLTKNGPTVKLYIDAIDRTATVTNRTILNTSDPLTIGSSPFDGLIDEVAIYARAVDAATVSRHFTAATSPF